MEDTTITPEQISDFKKSEKKRKKSALHAKVYRLWVMIRAVKDKDMNYAITDKAAKELTLRVLAHVKEAGIDEFFDDDYDDSIADIMDVITK